MYSKSACSWTNTLLLFHYLTVCQLTHLFIPLRNSNSLTPSGTLKTRITVPWESQYQIRSQYKQWSCSTKPSWRRHQTHFFRSTGQTGSWSIECDSSHMTGVSRDHGHHILQLITVESFKLQWASLSIKASFNGVLTIFKASYRVISPAVKLPGYARYELEWLTESAQRPGRKESIYRSFWPSYRSLWPRIDIATFWSTEAIKTVMTLTCRVLGAITPITQKYS